MPLNNLDEDAIEALASVLADVSGGPRMQAIATLSTLQDFYTSGNVRALCQEYGFSDEDIDRVTDPRLLRLLRDFADLKRRHRR